MADGQSLLDHRAVVARLQPCERRALLRKSDWAGTRQLAGHVTALGLMACGMTLGGVAWLPCLIGYSIVFVFLFTAQHESIHDTAFRSRWANRWLARAVGWLLFNPAIWFRYFHLAHHRHTQDPEQDPELASAKPERVRQYAWHLLGWHVIWAGVATVTHNALGRRFAHWLPVNQRAAVVRESRVSLVLYTVVVGVSLASGSWLWIEFWLLPLVLGQPALRLYLLAEHGRCPAVANMFENTRTTFSNALVRRLAWNMPYHAEHHAFPSVPFHQLPAWHQHVVTHLKCTERGYGQFHRRYYRGLDRVS